MPSEMPMGEREVSRRAVLDDEHDGEHDEEWV